ncbi:hypothetical protein GXM_04579 [Nostoc sphaeroides CCNUC1]|uniref:Uncharacterized protein n=1 Tax=Nostoc sphaeroides CCNUC1 TaxID=2653204 RepID=A0A5P8W2Z2_9NOSO|nr:hypothetical protein GXM_04579 [Nostoc sphaeroides CCNUC1]
MIAPSPPFPTNLDKIAMVLLNPKSDEKRSPLSPSFSSTS